MDYPILLTEKGDYLAILNHAYNIVVEDQLLTTSDGYETLTFNLSNNDKKRSLLANEREIEVQNRRYIIRVIEDLKNNSNVCTVTCDATWYDLNDGELKYLMHTDATTINAQTSVSQQLEGTDWTVDVVNVGGTRPKHTSENKETSLYNLRQIKGNFGGDLYFDTKNHKVSLLNNLGVKHQKIFSYDRNTTSIKRTIDTRNLFTRFTLIGKDADSNDVTIADINNGKDYLENYSWYDKMKLPRKIKWYKNEDDRWSNKENMKEYMEEWLAQYCQPIIGYELEVSLFDLSPELGDYVYVYDKDLGVGDWLRIVSRKRDILQPYKSTVELESTKKSIVETLVSNTSSAQDISQTVQSAISSSGATSLPAGTEDWIMQYKNGQWQASNVIGDINSLLDNINGEVL